MRMTASVLFASFAVLSFAIFAVTGLTFAQIVQNLEPQRTQSNDRQGRKEDQLRRHPGDESP